jgi:glyoxylase-like metal-dependent hydrolase (beta-lactamase superfamily II)
MKIGKYTLLSIQTGLFKLDGGAMFGVVPKTLWSRTNPSDEFNRIEMCMRALLLISDEKKILVDNGAGNKLSNKMKDIYAINHESYTLENELKKYSIAPEEITDVILTHLHFDHCGGTTKVDSNSELQLTFPNAVHHVQQRHWEWAMNPSLRDKASFLPGNYELTQKKGKLNLIKGDLQFDENIFLNIVNGHTPSQQIVTVHDGKKGLIHTADLIPMVSHIPLPYIMGYDLFPLTTLDEKKKYLGKIAEENMIMFFEHDPFTETCMLHKTEDGFHPAERRMLNEID